MISLVAALLLAQADAPAKPAAEAAPPAAEAKPAPLTPDQAIDANGVPAWAKRKHMKPVQNCTSRPNIGVETWRAEQDPNSKTGARRNVPIKTTCK